jgi:hypothetical protein
MFAGKVGAYQGVALYLTTQSFSLARKCLKIVEVSVSVGNALAYCIAELKNNYFMGT